MRLICPNCDAQYEVPDEVMPIDGRDVQCSNCGQTWFQHHPDHVPEPFDPDSDTEDSDEEVVTSDTRPKEPEPEFETQEEAPPAEGQADTDTETDDEDDEPEPEPEPDLSKLAPKRKDLDPAVADILREEAELEIQARRNDPAGSVESQPDLGLDEASGSDEADRRAREAADRMARMRGEDPPTDEAEAAAAAAALGSRRDLLPDIEEINSTLRSSNDRGSDDPAELANVVVREKRGFRRGFMFIVLLVAILALIYVYAPTIVEAVPALGPVLDGFVLMVDDGRAWLDTQITSFLTWLDAAASSSSS